MTSEPLHSPRDRPHSVTAGGLLREVAFQDWLVLAYFVVLCGASLTAAPSASRDRCLFGLGTLGLFFIATVAGVRGRLIQGTFWAPFAYRLGVYGSVQASYFFLRDLLVVVNPTRSLDTQLHQLDLALFGFEPALSMAAWVTPALTEWFSFFYFSYFCLLAFHIFPILTLARNQQLLGEFCFSMLWLFCAGHIVYLLVPGYGPVVALSHEFPVQLPSGLWYDMVMSTVSSAGAQMDIFPSLHTAAPLFLTLFAIRHRDRVPFRYVWPVLAFFSVNIMIATMYLRWHWVIDVVAGIAHASIALWLAARLTKRDLARRKALDLTPNWPRFEFAARERRDSRSSASPGTLRPA